MAKCYFCPETATEKCGLCFVPVCDQHKHRVNRWHNAFHASWICEDCYRIKEKKRKIVLVPFLLIFICLIAASMDVRWGLAEPSMWLYFFALATVLLAVVGAGTVYQLLIIRSSASRTWLYRLLAAAGLWGFFYLVYRILSA